jgi:small-conductance mechanosensitive channel
MRIGKALLTIVASSAGEHRYIQTRTVPLFDITVRTVIVGGAAYGILLAWHVDVTAWLASAGILGIAIGFAAKDTLANLFSGIFILADAPYKIGDYIVLDTGERGKVTEIGIRSTRILTRDDIQIIVPNAAIAAAKIVNESGGPHIKERVRVDVGVAYGSDIDQVRRVLMEIAAGSQLLAEDPEPRVRFRQLGESSLDFQLLGWVEDPELRGRAIDELLTTIYKRFAEENITIPFPQRDVHMRQT